MSPGSAEIVRFLQSRLPDRDRRVLDRPGRAAVLVPIVDDGGGPGLLLTRRADALPTHRGQVAFPGGHVDPADADPVATALRETEEEIGLPPARVEVLGLLDDQVTRDDTVAVTPVVGRVAALPPLRPQAGEVARVFCIPLAELSRSERWRAESHLWRGREMTLHFFEHDGEVLWGMSARIVLHLLEVAAARPV